MDVESLISIRKMTCTKLREARKRGVGVVTLSHYGRTIEEQEK